MSSLTTLIDRLVVSLPTRSATRVSRSAAALAGLLAGSGALHLFVPQPYMRIVPRWLPAPLAVVHLSGAAELLLAGALVMPSTRRAAALSAAGFFVVVFPANVQMALNLRRSGSALASGSAYARLPLQLPLVWWALKVAAAEQRSGDERHAD